MIPTRTVQEPGQEEPPYGGTDGNEQSGTSFDSPIRGEVEESGVQAHAPCPKEESGW